MKTDVAILWKFGEQHIRFIIAVPKEHKRLATKILNELYTDFITALKAYNYKIIKYTHEE